MIYLHEPSQFNFDTDKSVESELSADQSGCSGVSGEPADDGFGRYEEGDSGGCLSGV